MEIQLRQGEAKGEARQDKEMVWHCWGKLGNAANKAACKNNKGHIWVE